MSFNYEQKLWGINEVDLQPKFLGATRLKYCLKALKKIPKGKILEVGCGGGAFARAIKRHRPELTVIGGDINQEALMEARKVKGQVSYQEADVYDLPFRDAYFAAVVSFDVWEHLKKPKKALEEAFRVLKPGGVFHSFIPIEGEKLTLYQLFPKTVYQAKQKYGGHIQAYTKERLFKLLSAAGFRIKETGFSGYYFHQLVDLAYFNFLRFKKGARLSVEGYLSSAKGSFFDRALGLATILFGWATYLENKFFQFLPAGGIHITVIK